MSRHESSTQPRRNRPRKRKKPDHAPKVYDAEYRRLESRMVGEDEVIRELFVNLFANSEFREYGRFTTDWSWPVDVKPYVRRVLDNYKAPNDIKFKIYGDTIHFDKLKYLIEQSEAATPFADKIEWFTPDTQILKLGGEILLHAIVRTIIVADVSVKNTKSVQKIPIYSNRLFAGTQKRPAHQNEFVERIKELIEDWFRSHPDPIHADWFRKNYASCENTTKDHLSNTLKYMENTGMASLRAVHGTPVDTVTVPRAEFEEAKQDQDKLAHFYRVVETKEFCKFYRECSVCTRLSKFEESVANPPPAKRQRQRELWAIPMHSAMHMAGESASAPTTTTTTTTMAADPRLPSQSRPAIKEETWGGGLFESTWPGADMDFLDPSYPPFDPFFPVN